MRLETLAKLLGGSAVGNTDVEISGLCADSRKVKKGDLFFCYKGEKFDSHSCAAQVAAAGAAALVCEKARLSASADNRIRRQGGGGKSRPRILRRGRQKPQTRGGDGHQRKDDNDLYARFRLPRGGKKCAIIGTLGISYAGRFIAPELTTPDPVYLHSVFRDMADCGVEYVFMEVSAHALYFDKIAGLKFEAGIFTNCTQDHLDFLPI